MGNNMNLLPEILTDYDYEKLRVNNFLNEGGITRYRIAVIYRELRAKKMKRYNCIDKIQEMFPADSFDTILKYSTSKLIEIK